MLQNIGNIITVSKREITASRTAEMFEETLNIASSPIAEETSAIRRTNFPEFILVRWLLYKRDRYQLPFSYKSSL